MRSSLAAQLTGGSWNIAGTLATSGPNITVNYASLVLNGPAANFTQSNTISDNRNILAIVNGRTYNYLSGPFSNTGLMVINAGGAVHLNSLSQNNAGDLTEGAWYVGLGSTLQIDNGPAITTNHGVVSLFGTFDKLNSLVNNYGTFELGRNFTAQAAFHNHGTLTINATSTFTAPNGLVQHAGALLNGTGTLAGNLTNSGKVAPGNSPGILTITGDYTQTTDGSLEIEVGGLTPGTLHDKLAVTGAATLAGRLEVPIVSVPNNPAYIPQLNDEITFLTAAGGVSGRFDSLSAPNLSSVSSLAIKVFKSADQKEVHLKFVTPTNVLFTDTHNADWENNIIWSSSIVPDTDNPVTVQNNALGGSQRLEVQAANAYTDGLLVRDTEADIIMGVKNNKTLSAAVDGITIGQHATIELGAAGNPIDRGTLATPSTKTVSLQDGGVLKGNGQVIAQTLVVSNGTVDPGFSVGHLDVAGDYQQSSNGTLLVDVETGGQRDTIDVSGAVQLGGTLRVDTSAITSANPGATYEIISAGSLSGQFVNVESRGNPNIYFLARYDYVGGGASLGEFERGDMNGSGGPIDQTDADLFVFGLMNASVDKYSVRCGYCGVLPQQGGDFSENGWLDFADIAYFPGQGMGSGLLAEAFERYFASVPEPASGMLIVVGGLLGLFIRPRIRRAGGSGFGGLVV